MENLSKKERHELHLQRQRQEAEEVRKKREGELSKAKSDKSKKTRIYLIIGIISIVVIFGGLGYSIYASKLAPGAYDSFAKCLTDKGAVMYGAMSWCHFTQEQAAMFGNSFKYINYHEYNKRDDIKITPTWVISGQRYERVQSFDKLAQLTGCSLTST